MIVCVCEAVSDRRIRAEVRDGHHTVRSIGRSCGAGTDCGQCRSAVKQLIAQTRSESTPGSLLTGLEPACV